MSMPQQPSQAPSSREVQLAANQQSANTAVDRLRRHTPSPQRFLDSLAAHWRGRFLSGHQLVRVPPSPDAVETVAKWASATQPESIQRAALSALAAAGLSCAACLDAAQASLRSALPLVRSSAIQVFLRTSPRAADISTLKLCLADELFTTRWTAVRILTPYLDSATLARCLVSSQPQLLNDNAPVFLEEWLSAAAPLGEAALPTLQSTFVTLREQLSQPSFSGHAWADSRSTIRALLATKR